MFFPSKLKGEKSMKLAIDQKVLVRALERGAMSALSDGAQSDTSSFHRLIQAVKITVKDEKLTLESGTNLLATKWSTDASKENGVEVKEEGSVLVPAKELHSWTLKQNKAKIVLTLSKLDKPEILKAGDSDTDYGSKQAMTIKKIGVLKLASRDESKTGNKWNLDCYDPEQMNSVDFESAPEKVITSESEQLNQAIKNVGFSSQTKDYQHIFDSFSIERFNNNIHILASDTHRCSVYHLDKATNVDEDFFTESIIKDGKITNGQKILIPAVFLKSIAKMSDGLDLDISYDKDKSKIYVSVGDWKIRMATADSQSFNKFPSVALLASKGYSILGDIPKTILVNRLISASLVNKHMVLFDFKKSNENVVIHAISEIGHSPNVSNAPVEQLVKDVKAIWGVQHIIDVAKVIKDDNIRFMVPEDLRSVKVVSESDPNLEYYSMVIDNPKYAHLLKD
jgi:DNA polymerase III sliding clamp (beta) subunit (PCNA family)